MLEDCRDMLHLVQPGMKGVEIGVHCGYSSAAFLTAGAFMYLIDPWENYSGYPHSRGDEGYESTLGAVRPYAGQYVLLRKRSAEAALDVPDGLDFVFIDGNHTYEYVRQDIRDYWPKVKPGGWLTGHDYVNSDPDYQVKRAVDEFVAQTGLPLIVSNVKSRAALITWMVRKPVGHE